MKLLLNRIHPHYLKECIDDVSLWGEVCLATVKGDVSLSSIKLNKDVKLYSEKTIIYDIFDLNCKWLLGDDEISWLQQYEGVYLAITSRKIIKVNSSTGENLLKHFYEQVNFWFNMLEIHKIEYCLSYSHPGDAGSFCLHLAAKYKRVPHIFRDIAIIANKFQYLSCSLESRNLLMEYGDNNKEIASFLHSYLDKIEKKDPSSVPFYIKGVDAFKTNIVDYSKEKESFKRKFIRYLMLTRKSSFYIDGRSISLRKLKGIGFISLNIERWSVLFYSEIMKLKYRKLSSDPLKTKYIFLADSLIPEEVNSPQALHNRRVEFLIKYIHSYLPKDVTIVYKVNPAQFLYRDYWWMISRNRLKNKEWFIDAKRLYNLTIVRDDYPSSELIKNSIGVATINGTICLEALAHNKRTMTISPTWLDGVYGIHRVKSSHDAGKIIDLMMNDNFDNNKVDFSNVFGDSGCIFEPKNIDYLNFSGEDYKIINRAMLEAIRVYPQLSLDREKV